MEPLWAFLLVLDLVVGMLAGAGLSKLRMPRRPDPQAPVTDVAETAPESNELVRFRHELRTPLASVIGHLDLALAGSVTSSQTRTWLVTARRNSERLATLLSGEPESESTATPDHTPAGCDLRALIEDRLTAAWPAISARSLVVSVECPDGVHPVAADEMKLGQVLDNVLGNAIKYNETGGWIDVRLRPAPVGRTKLVVSNSGQTLTAAERAQVFEPGFRTTAAVLAGEQGDGVGLAIAREMVEGFGGTLVMTSSAARAVTAIELTLASAASQVATDEQLAVETASEDVDPALDPDLADSTEKGA